MKDIDLFLKLHKKYGYYTKNGQYMDNHEIYDFYMQRPEIMKNKIIKAELWLLIPILGFIIMYLSYKKIGIDPL